MSRFPFGPNRDPKGRSDSQNYVHQEPYLRRDVPPLQGGMPEDPYAGQGGYPPQGHFAPPQGQDPRYGYQQGAPRQDYYQQEPRMDPYAGQRPQQPQQPFQQSLGSGGYEDPRYYTDPQMQHAQPSMFDPRMASSSHDSRNAQYPYEEQPRSQMPPRGAPGMDPGLFWRQEEEESYPHYSNDPERYSDRPSPLRFVFAITGLIIIATISWFAYRWASQGYSEPPVIEAEAGPYKVRPENPGGINIPHQDKLIYGRLAHNSEQPAERLLPPVDQAPVLPPQQPMMQNQPVYQAVPPAGSVETLPPQQMVPQQNMGQPEMMVAPQPVYVQQQPQLQQGTPVMEMPQQPANYAPQAVYPAQYQHPSAVTTQQTVQAMPPAQPQPMAQAPQKQLDDVLKEDASTQPVKADAKASEAKATSNGSGIFVQLATLPNAQTAEEELKRLKAKYAAELGNVGGSVKPFDMSDGRKFRVMMGPFKTRSAALDRCKSINSAKPGSCRVTQVP